MLHFTRGDYDAAIAKLQSIVAEDPASFDSQLALGMAFCRKGDLAQAIVEGHKAEKLRPQDELVHTNLSVFYMKSGDKGLAEHHAMRSRMASWKTQLAQGSRPTRKGEPELRASADQPARAPVKTPDFPWKKKPGPATSEPNSQP